MISAQWQTRVWLLFVAASLLAACSNTVVTEPLGPKGAGTTGMSAANRDAVDSLFDAGVGMSNAAVLLDDTAAVRGIACGVALPVVCTAEEQKCCVRSLAVDTCLARDAVCGCDLLGCEVMEVRCDGPEDCRNGESCCGTLTVEDGNTTGYSSFTCAPQCRPEQNQRAACHTAADTCAAGLICSGSQFLTNMHVCVGADSVAQ